MEVTKFVKQESRHFSDEMFNVERKINMNIYKCTLEIINMSEWTQHISDVLKQTQNTNDVLERICNFDFKFDTILQ